MTMSRDWHIHSPLSRMSHADFFHIWKMTPSQFFGFRCNYLEGQKGSQVFLGLNLKLKVRSADVIDRLPFGAGFESG